MKTPAQTLRDIRNKHFPPKLEFGCEVRCGDEISYIQNDLNIKPEDLSPIKVFGKPTSLNDVLRMLDKNEGDSLLYVIDMQGQMWKRNGGKVLALNLSKGIEEQDDEVLEKLIELLSA